MKRDRRGRRNRNTLTVDLGATGTDQLAFCQERLGAWARQRAAIHRRAKSRGDVIRIALQVLVHALHGDMNPLAKALGATTCVYVTRAEDL